VLFYCDGFDLANPQGTQYLRLNCIYEINHSRRYEKYYLFIIADVAYQVFYIPYPSGVPLKANWWAALLNKPRVFPHMPNDGEKVIGIF